MFDLSNNCQDYACGKTLPEIDLPHVFSAHLKWRIVGVTFRDGCGAKVSTEGRSPDDRGALVCREHVQRRRRACTHPGRVLGGGGGQGSGGLVVAGLWNP